MSRIKVTVDGTVLMDSDMGQWSSTPPDMTKLSLTPTDGVPKAWMLAIHAELAMAGAASLSGQTTGDTEITVQTSPGGYTITKTAGR